MPGSASLGILDTIQKRVDRSRRGFFALATLRSSCVPASLVRKSTSMLHDYTNTELPQGQKRYVETSEAVVTLTVSPSHFTFFFRYFTPSSRNVRERGKVRKERDSATRLSQKRCARRRVCIKYRSQGWALAPHTLAFREEKRDKIAQLKRSSLRDMLCTVLHPAAYTRLPILALFSASFFFLFTLRCICDRLPSTYRKSLRAVLVTNAKEGSVPARQSHRISASRQLLLLLLLLLLHCCC